MNLAHYLLQVNLYLIAFYVLFKVLLAKETYFLFNRIYLVGAGLLSLVIPYIRLDFFAKKVIHQQFYAGIDQLMVQGMFVPEVEQQFNWGFLLVILYVFGVVFFALKLVFKLFHLNRIFKVGTNGQAFSFLNKKRISSDLREQDTIIQHEIIHVKQLHTLDVLFFELLGIINWFNPVIYLFKYSVKNIHEYLADEQASAFQKDKETYALLLLSYALNVSPNTLTNSFFNKGMLKKRVYMLHKKRSKKAAVLKYGLCIPLFGLAIILSSSAINKNKQILEVSNQIPMNDLADIQNALNAPISAVESITKSQNIEPNKQKNMKSKLKLALLALTGVVAQTSSAQINDTSKFITKDSVIKIEGLKGGVSGIKIRGKSDTAKLSGFDTKNPPIFVVDGILFSKEDVEKVSPINIHSVSVLKDKPATDLYGDKGKNGVVIIATKSGLRADEGKRTSEYFQRTKPNTLSKDSIPNGVFDFVSIEKQPEFPGGIKAFYAYVGENIRYPKKAMENNVQGKVFLSFVVEKDGSLTNIQITRGLGSGTDEESIRILSNSPKWKPGIQFGVPVRVQYNLNINFTLSK